MLKLIRIVALAAVFYYAVIDQPNSPKILTALLQNTERIAQEVRYIHNQSGQLTQLGFATRPRLVFDRTRLFTGWWGVYWLRLFRLKEFDHFTFQFGKYVVQMAYA